MAEAFWPAAPGPARLGCGPLEPAPWIGGIKSHAAGLPLLHWSTTGGELRVPHFAATQLIRGWHALHAHHVHPDQPTLGAWGANHGIVRKSSRLLTLLSIPPNWMPLRLHPPA